MKFINFVKYRDLALIANARPAHFAYADRLRAEGKLAIGGQRDEQWPVWYARYMAAEQAGAELPK